MTKILVAAPETEVAADATEATASDAPDPEAIAAHVIAGGSPFDLTERPDWFSYSTLDAFDRCPRQYALRYLCRLEAGQPRPAADFGSAAHAAFEQFTRERRERLASGEEPPDRADLGRFFEAAWAGSALPAENDAAAWRARAEPMLDSFWAAESANPATTIGEEVRFRMDLPIGPESAVVVSGYIDRIDRLPSGGVELIDYKTGRAGWPGEAESSLQLSIYALGCREALDLGGPERVTLDFVEQGLRLSDRRTDAQLDGVRDGLAARAREIRSSGFPATPSGRACGWCDFRELCPESARTGDGDADRQATAIPVTLDAAAPGSG
jgi:DNA helicase-2/ATP-dependent DNA helicase PcrA